MTAPTFTIHNVLAYLIDRALQYARGKEGDSREALLDAVRKLASGAVATFTREAVWEFLFSEGKQWLGRGGYVSVIDAAEAIRDGVVEECIAHGELAEPKLRLSVENWIRTYGREGAAC